MIFICLTSTVNITSRKSVTWSVSKSYLFLNHDTTYLFKLFCNLRKDNPRSFKERALTKFSPSNSIMANLRVTSAWQRANFSTQAQFPIAKFFRSFHLRYRINPVAQALSACRHRGIKRCALCTVRHITGLTSPGKYLSAVIREILTCVRQKKRARHVRNVTENIFPTSHEIFPLSDREKNIGTKYNE